jgi:hypothetical protein
MLDILLILPKQNLFVFLSDRRKIKYAMKKTLTILLAVI